MEEVVYFYNWENLIYITRYKNGEWHWESKPKELFNCLNKNTDKKYRIESHRDWMCVGVTTGIEIKKILDYCKKSFGDE